MGKKSLFSDLNFILNPRFLVWSQISGHHCMKLLTFIRFLIHFICCISLLSAVAISLSVEEIAKSLFSQHFFSANYVVDLFGAVVRRLKLSTTEVKCFLASAHRSQTVHSKTESTFSVWQAAIQLAAFMWFLAVRVQEELISKFLPA